MDHRTQILTPLRTSFYQIYEELSDDENIKTLNLVYSFINYLLATREADDLLMERIEFQRLYKAQSFIEEDRVIDLSDEEGDCPQCCNGCSSSHYLEHL
jgi:hypothetical protein